MSSSLRFTFWIRFFGEARSTVFLHIYTHFTILWLHKSLLVTQRDVRGGRLPHLFTSATTDLYAAQFGRPSLPDSARGTA